VRVADKLILSAAHCATGSDGKSDVTRFVWENCGTQVELERVEMARSPRPGASCMTGWCSRGIFLPARWQRWRTETSSLRSEESEIGWTIALSP
jgi:hypothetical protein